jgi:hypothetical protein
MKNFHSGFNIVFGGPEFIPGDFLRDSRLPSGAEHVVERGAVLKNGEVAGESWIEFADIREGSYPLDAFSEALWILRNYREEFLRLSRFPGVMIRTLNIFGDDATCTMEISPADIALLHELSVHLSICPSGSGEVT